MKTNLWFFFFIGLVLKPCSAQAANISLSHFCPTALVSNSTFKSQFHHIENVLLGFSNELLPQFENPIQEFLFRIYVQVYFKPEKKHRIQGYVTSTITEAKKYSHLLPYKKSFRRFQIEPSLGSLKTVRPLSFVEAPLRGCLGNDCSTHVYMEIAFHPNYYYFTLTNQAGISKGHITIVLGNARYKHAGTIVSVAFIDKIQNVSDDDLPLMIEAVRQSILEHGYVLALPDQLGDHVGISTSDLTHSFIKNHIPLLRQQPLRDFSPHTYPSQVQLPQNTHFSRAGMKLLLFPVRPLGKSFANNISRGSIVFPWNTRLHVEASALHDYLEFLLQNNPDMSLSLAYLLLSAPDEIKRLDIFQDLTFHVLRQVERTALYALFLKAALEMDTYTTSLIVHEHEFDINETSFWDGDPVLHFALRTTHPRKKEMIAHLLSLGADINARNSLHRLPLHEAISSDLVTANDLDIDIIRLLLDHKADVNAKINDFDLDTPLSLAKATNNKELIDLLLEHGATEIDRVSYWRNIPRP